MRINDVKSIRFKTERRALLAEKKDQEYKECIRKFFDKNSMTEAAVKSAVLKHYEVPVETYENQLLILMQDERTSNIIKDLDKKIAEAKVF